MDKGEIKFKKPAKGDMPAREVFKAPFRYEREGTRILDANGVWVADMRGWGYLTGTGGLNLNRNVAAKTQDQMAEWIVELMNEYYDDASMGL
jgi:hypothetical protein